MKRTAMVGGIAGLVLWMAPTTPAADCSREYATHTGTDHDDILHGTSGADGFAPGDGDDTVYGHGCADDGNLGRGATERRSAAAMTGRRPAAGRPRREVPRPAASPSWRCRNPTEADRSDDEGIQHGSGLDSLGDERRVLCSPAPHTGGCGSYWM